MRLPLFSFFLAQLFVQLNVLPRLRLAQALPPGSKLTTVHGSREATAPGK